MLASESLLVVLLCLAGVNCRPIGTHNTPADPRLRSGSGVASGSRSGSGSGDMGRGMRGPGMRGPDNRVPREVERGDRPTGSDGTEGRANRPGVGSGSGSRSGSGSGDMGRGMRGPGMRGPDNRVTREVERGDRPTGSDGTEGRANRPGVGSGSGSRSGSGSGDMGRGMRGPGMRGPDNRVPREVERGDRPADMDGTWGRPNRPGVGSGSGSSGMGHGMGRPDHRVPRTTTAP
jgi:hypothetical protein